MPRRVAVWAASAITISGVIAIEATDHRLAGNVRAISRSEAEAAEETIDAQICVGMTQLRASIVQNAFREVSSDSAERTVAPPEQISLSGNPPANRHLHKNFRGASERAALHKVADSRRSNRTMRDFSDSRHSQLPKLGDLVGIIGDAAQAAAQNKAGELAASVAGRAADALNDVLDIVGNRVDGVVAALNDSQELMVTKINKLRDQAVGPQQAFERGLAKALDPIITQYDQLTGDIRTGLANVTGVLSALGLQVDAAVMNELNKSFQSLEAFGDVLRAMQVSITNASLAGEARQTGFPVILPRVLSASALVDEVSQRLFNITEAVIGKLSPALPAKSVADVRASFESVRINAMSIAERLGKSVDTFVNHGLIEALLAAGVSEQSGAFARWRAHGFAAVCAALSICLTIRA